MEKIKNKNSETSIAKTPNDEAQVAQFIQQAIAKNLPVETMERLFALHKDVKAEKAREEFVSALSKFQKEMPVITKDKKVLNKDGKTIRYQYAPLESIIEQIKESLTNNGLSYTWKVKNREGFIKAIAKITHIFGHSEESSFEVPIDKEGYMTMPQKYASALTFAKRYSLCDALGISTADEDTDATDVNKEKSAKSLKAQIVLLLRNLGEKNDTKEQCEKAVKNLTKLELANKNYQEIISRLEALISEKQEYDNSKV
jgi:hypothetical protein